MQVCWVLCGFFMPTSVCRNAKLVADVNKRYAVMALLLQLNGQSDVVNINDSGVSEPQVAKNHYLPLTEGERATL